MKSLHRIRLTMDPFHPEPLAEAAGVLEETGCHGTYQWYDSLAAYAIFETEPLPWPRALFASQCLFLSRLDDLTWLEGDEFSFDDVHVKLVEAQP